ncbi:hypothetical protein FJT64_015951 [Amphibalanus amphitrite]|uniref:C-type lectin domain-containing protein n=1 Tax=Amphibalanus amphitrite TaxID=1232801 RepID=A0A6A4X2K6_AMPAM|nr:hypothetical protein FJT64_015951 [Amphibalanus amphitrite]
MMTWTLRLTLVAAAVTTITATCPSYEWKQFRDKCYWNLWYMDDPDYRGGNCALINYYVEGMWAGLGCSDFYYQFMCQQTRLRGDVITVSSDVTTITMTLTLRLTLMAAAVTVITATCPSSEWKQFRDKCYWSLWYMDDPDYRGGNCALINYYVEGMWGGLGCSDFYYHFMCQEPRLRSDVITVSSDVTAIMMTLTLRLTLVAAAVSVTAAMCPYDWKQFRNKWYWISDYKIRDELESLQRIPQDTSEANEGQQNIHPTIVKGEPDEEDAVFVEAQEVVG